MMLHHSTFVLCYDAAFKLKVINFAKGMNNSSAAREFGVNAQTVERIDDFRQTLIHHSWKYESGISVLWLKFVSGW